MTLEASLAFAAPGELSEQRCATALPTRDLERSPHEVTVQLRTATLQTVLSSVRLEPGEAVVLTIPESQGGAATMPPKYLLLRPTLR